MSFDSLYPDQWCLVNTNDEGRTRTHLAVEAKEMYLNARKQEVSQSTLDGYHYRLKHFIRWCETVEGIENMNILSGRDLQRYDGDLKPISLEGRFNAYGSSSDDAGQSTRSSRTFTRGSRR